MQTMQTIRWLGFLIVVTKLFAARNEMARDYFVFKNVPSVVAFLCSNATNDLRLKKILNKEGISSAFLYPDFKFSLETAMTVRNVRYGVFLDLHCANWYSEFILTESSKLKAYNESYSWLLFGKSLNESVRIVNDDQFGISTDLVIATPADTKGSYRLHDVYNHGKERQGVLNVTEFGSWHNETGLNVTLVQEKYERRRNFHGMKLKVIAVTQYRPHDVAVEDYLKDYSGRPLDSMSKFAYALLLYMGDMFNFTMEITETTLWEQVDADGTHLGMIGMLQRNEVDLGASPARMTAERNIITALVGPVWPFRTCFMFRSIPTGVSDEFIHPFTPGSWALIGGMCAICAIVLALLLKMEFIGHGISRWSEAVVIVTGIMCQQGSTLNPRYISSRLVVIHLLLFSLLVYNYYSASVVSAQLNQPIDKMNDSLHQLTQSHLEIAAEPITYTNYGLANPNDWEVKEFYTKRWMPLTDEIRYVSLEEGFKRVARGGFAYHTEPNTGYPYVERMFSDQMICELTEVHLFKPQKMGFFARRNSPFTKMAKIGWTKYSSAGILAREVRRWVSRKPLCLQGPSSVQSVTILTTAPAFLILFAGILLASSICVVENLIEEYMNYHNRTVKPTFKKSRLIVSRR